jgi:hypothetical protein
MSDNWHVERPPERDAFGQAKAEKLIAEGWIVGMMCCTKCFAVSSLFFKDHVDARDLVCRMCPACQHIGSIFMPDDPCLSMVCPNL